MPPTSAKKIDSFPLLSLPPETISEIVQQSDVSTRSKPYAYKGSSFTFPHGPLSDFLALSTTCTLLHTLCRPLIWKSIFWKPLSYEGLDEKTGLPNDPKEAARSIRVLCDLLRSAKGTKRGEMKIELFTYVSWDANFRQFRNRFEQRWIEDEAEYASMIISHPRSSLKAVYLDWFNFDHWNQQQTVMNVWYISQREVSRFRLSINAEEVTSEEQCQRITGYEY